MGESGGGFARGVPEERIGRAIFAGGCFWGVEHHFSKLPGVLAVVSGYTGGHQERPTYQQVCAGNTGHLEAVSVQYDRAQVDYETLARLFFEIHDPTQADGQGPDLGEQYQSAVFYLDQEQKRVAEYLVARLRAQGYEVVTALRPAEHFWPAEEYHQNYYAKTGKEPYCHTWVRRFD